MAPSTHTAITAQSSRSLTYQPPARVRSPLTTILVGNTGLLLLLHSVKKKLWLSLLIGCRHKHDVRFVTCQTRRSVCVISSTENHYCCCYSCCCYRKQHESLPYYCTTNSHIIRNLQTTIFAEGLPSQHRPLASCLGIEH